MKKLIFLTSLFLLISSVGCEKPESRPITTEGKTGLETNSAVSEEVDSLNRKMDQLMQSVQQ